MEPKQENILIEPPCITGLTYKEVMSRKESGLVNRTYDKITKTTGEIIYTNLFTLFNAYNFCIGLALMLVGAYSNLFYLLVVCVNIITGIVQEIHAKKMVENLSLLSAVKATVVREGKTSEVDVEDIVLDDSIVLDAGRQISADAIVTEGEIEVNESLLTGEADPVVKRPGDRLLSGSFVISGKCYAKVEHVGKDNFATKLSLEAKKTKQASSRLMRSMRQITRLTSFFIIPIGIVLFVQALFFRSQPMDSSVITTATALLGMLPKGLVLLISISLVSGILRLSRKKVLVQELYCLENLAQADVLCLDKTGTITEGKISVSEVYEVDTAGLPFSIDTAIKRFIGASDDNNATFSALKEYFGSESVDQAVEKTAFSSERKWSSVTFKDAGTLIVGAPEKITCNKPESLPKEALEAQREGKRIICLGYTRNKITDGKVPENQLAAVIALKDTVRPNVKETLDFFKNEGVDVKIISGDNPVTVSQIAKQAGLENYEAYVDLSKIQTEEEIEQAALRYSIFGRVTPNQKKDLVKAFQKQGHTVAMTGDGVNDVLALKEADCSVAMNSGSDAAKQVAQLVLLHSDFSVLPDIVMEGRRVVNNITNVGGIFLVKTIYSVLLSILCILANIPFPFIPLQITLVDMFIEGYPSFFLQFEANHKVIQDRFLNQALKRAFPFAVAIVTGIALVYVLAPGLRLPFNESVTIMFYLTGFLSILAVWKACRPFNAYKVFLFVSTAIGFYSAAWLFSGLLTLNRLAFNHLLVFLGLAAICMVISTVVFVIIGFISKKRGRLEK